MNEAQISSPKFDANNEKWIEVKKFSQFLTGANLKSHIAIKAIEFMNSIDSVEDPIERKNTKLFISSPQNISESSTTMVLKLESLIVLYGGWSKWKDSVLSLIKNLDRPSALLIWLIDDSKSPNSIIIKSNSDKTEFHQFVCILLANPNLSIRPPLCLVLSKLGDISLVKKLLPSLLSVATGTTYGSEISYSNICTLIQSFGFNGELCSIVETFFASLPPSNETFLHIWNMFFQQSSLKRLRLMATRNIVRFGRLIGSSKSLSNRKQAILKLVLNVKFELEKE